MQPKTRQTPALERTMWPQHLRQMQPSPANLMSGLLLVVGGMVTRERGKQSYEATNGDRRP